MLHPTTRGRFLDAPRPAPLERLYYESGDGWRAPLWQLATVPGGAGEPVLLAHGLGSSADALRYGSQHSLASALSAAGFAVFLWAHRADVEAIPPNPRARSQVDFDAILERDLPAAVERVLGVAGTPRLHFVGHGLGGQLGLCWAAGRPEALATVVALAAPMRFERQSSAVRTAARALGLIPERWRLPLRAASRVVAPFLDDGSMAAELGAQCSDGARVRGALTYGAEDVPVRLLRQVLSWQEHGGPVAGGGALDWREALANAQVPLLVVVGSEDRVCPPSAGHAAAETWGGEAHTLDVDGHGHADLLLGADADQRVFGPVSDWLVGHRRKAWLDTSSVQTTVDLNSGAAWPRAANESPRTS